MTLEQHIRNKTAKYIRPLLIKSECEICKIENNLELHHIKPFAELLTECLSNLQLDKMIDMEDYSEVELENIINYMLGVQLQTQYLTLCTQCHKETHEEIGALCNIGDNFKLHYEKEEKIKQLEEKYRIANVIVPYLESVLGQVMLQLKDRKELVEIVNAKQNGKLLRSLESINLALEEKNIMFRVDSFQTSRIVDGKKKNYKSAWRVKKLNEN